MIKSSVITLFMLFLSLASAFPQQPFFVDGYHGGVYGHYPMWVTQFMLDKLSAHPEWKLGLEIEPETWDTVKVKEPEAYNRFKAIATDKRIEFTNPTFAQPYCYNISGESIIRQFQYGMEKMHDHFPDVEFTTYAVEEPCFTSSLPQILKQLGFKYAVLKCPNTLWGGYTRAYGKDLVNWIGPDGTAILSVPRYGSEALEENSTWQTTAWNNSDAFLQSSFAYGIKAPVGMCYQDAGWKNGPWLGHGDHIKNNSIYVTWKEYMEDISAGTTDDDWHFTQEDMLVNLMWGSQALQRIAQQVRRSENSIVMAEKIGAMANIDNRYVASESDIREAWRMLMLAQHHDSWIVPYNRLKGRQTWAEAIRDWTSGTDTISAHVVAEAINSYQDSETATGNGLGYIRVFNTVGAPRAEVVTVQLPQSYRNKELALRDSRNVQIASRLEDTDGELLLTFKPTVANFGYATYELREEKQPDAAHRSVAFDENGNCTVENDRYKIMFDKSKGGAMVSLVAKHADHKEFAVTDGTYSLGEISGYFYDDNQFFSSAQSEARISVLEDNAFRIRVKIEGHIASHPFSQIVTLETGQKRIDFDLTIDWKENVGIGEYRQTDEWRANRRAFTDDRYKLKVMFPNSLGAAKLFKNAPFDVCESNLENTFFGQWDEIKHNVILNWVDLVQENDAYGLAVLTDHTTSYAYGKDYPLSLTAQYSGVGLWGVNYSITGPLKMNYALIPHKDKWDKAQISEQSAGWNEPLVAAYGADLELEDRAFIETDRSGFEITSMQVVGDDILLRLFNAEGNDTPRKIAFDFPVLSIEEVLLNGDSLKKLNMDREDTKNVVYVGMPRYGIKTLRIKKEETCHVSAY